MTKVKVARNSPVSAAIVAKLVIKLISVGMTTKNSHLCPNWWKKKGETELNAIPKENNEPGQGGEVLLMVANTMEFVCRQKYWMTR